MCRELLHLAHVHRRDGQMDSSGVLIDLTSGWMADLVAGQADQICDGVERQRVSEPMWQLLSQWLNALAELCPEREVVAARFGEFLGHSRSPGHRGRRIGTGHDQEGTLRSDSEHDGSRQVAPPVERLQGFGEVQLNKVVKVRNLAVNSVQVAIRITRLPAPPFGDTFPIGGETPLPVVGTRALTGGVEVEQTITNETPKHLPDLGLGAAGLLMDAANEVWAAESRGATAKAQEHSSSNVRSHRAIRSPETDRSTLSLVVGSKGVKDVDALGFGCTVLDEGCGSLISE